jgi:hypothetical protein
MSHGMQGTQRARTRRESADHRRPLGVPVNTMANMLFPANHKMVPIALGVSVIDNCDAAVAQSCHIVSIVSGEPVLGTGDGDTAPETAPRAP